MEPTHEPPIAPFARLKLSSTGVFGNDTGGVPAEIVTPADATPPRPSLTLSTAVYVPVTE